MTGRMLRVGRVLAGLALLAGTVAQAMTPVLPPAEMFFKNSAVRWMGLSPDSRQVAMTALGQNGRVGLFVIDVDHPDQPRPVVAYDNSDIAKAHWVRSRLVFNAVDLDEGSGWDKRLGNGLFVIDAAGGRARQLVRRDRSARVAMGESNRAPLIGSHTPPFFPEAADAENIVIGDHVYSGRELDRVEPAWLNLATGVKRPMKLGDVPAHAREWWFAPNGEARALVTIFEGRREIFWRGPGDAAWRKLAEAASFELPWYPQAVDAQGQLFVAMQVPGGTTQLIQWDPVANKAVGKPISAPAGFDFRGEAVLTIDGKLVGARTDAERERATWLDTDRGALQQLVDAQWPDHVNRIQCERCTSSDAVVLVHSWSDRDPGRWTLMRRQDKPGGEPNWTAHVLGSAQPGVDPTTMAGVQFTHVKARDGQSLPVWITRPNSAAAGQALPVVVHVHGGPWSRGHDWQWQPMEQFLASRGYLVISPEFRGSLGYGFDLFHAGWKQWGGAMQDDLVDVLRWAQQTGLATQNACIFGASYGGYATLMGLVRDANAFRCGAAEAAPSDPLLLLEGSWWMDDDMSDMARQYDLKKLIGDPVADREALLAASPLAQAARIKSPLLLAYGEDDRRVPLAHGNRLREAMTAAGNTPEWVTYPGEGHSWRKVSTKVDFAQKLEAFLARNLTGPR